MIRSGWLIRTGLVNIVVAVVASGTFAVAAASASEEGDGYVDEDSERDFGILGTSSTFTGTGSGDEILVGQRSNWLCGSGYQYVACVEDEWQYGGCYTGTGDLVLVYGYGGDDTFDFARTTLGDVLCGEDYEYVYAMDRATCPEILVYCSFGVDTVNGSDCADVIYGGSGDDILDGWVGNDQIYGEAGDDYLWGYYGADIVDGGTGTSDRLRGESDADCLRDSDGWSVADCGSGYDNYELSGSPTSCEYYGCIY